MRAFAPGCHFSLTEHSHANGAYAVLRVEHRARNNLAGQANASAEPLYANQATVQALAEPVRAARQPVRGPAAPLGVQTAIVVGAGQSVHTDRDHRIKVQFHWQRGAGSSSRLDHSAEANAPADAASFTWVRVAQSLAGPNWGAKARTPNKPSCPKRPHPERHASVATRCARVAGHGGRPCRHRCRQSHRAKGSWRRAPNYPRAAHEFVDHRRGGAIP